MRASFSIEVGGLNITANVSDLLISLHVTLRVGTHGDHAALEIDDSYGRVLLPSGNSPCIISLGWDGSATPVFFGYVDKVTSHGSRGGRKLDVTCKSFDTMGKAKQHQNRHFDKKSVRDMLSSAGQTAGVTGLKIDPELGSIMRPYAAMVDESFIHFGERLAREIGGNFKVVGNEAQMTKRNGTFTAVTNVAWGQNLHSWSIEPAIGRPQFKSATSRYYDRKKAKTVKVNQSANDRANAEYAHRWLKAHYPHDADPTVEPVHQAKSDSATSKRDKGGGSVSIEGNPGAIPDGLCIISGTRPGIDGTYRIETVEHSLSRGSGFTTHLTLKDPSEGAGSDGRIGGGFADGGSIEGTPQTGAGNVPGGFPG